MRRLEPGARWTRWKERADAFLPGVEDDDEHAALDRGLTWCALRTLDVGHLARGAPRVTFVCVEDLAIVTCEPGARDAG